MKSAVFDTSHQRHVDIKFLLINTSVIKLLWVLAPDTYRVMLEAGYPGRVVWSLLCRTHSHLMRKKHQTNKQHQCRRGSAEENEAYIAWEGAMSSCWEVEEEVVRMSQRHTSLQSQGHTKAHKKRNFSTDHMGKEDDIFTWYWCRCLLSFPRLWVRQRG